jgi:hypothetical protein
MHRYPLEPVEGQDKLAPAEQAELAAYRHGGVLYVPGIALQRALVAAAAFSKGKGRATLQKPVAACLMVDPEYLLLGTNDYVVDARAVVIPATKGRIVRYRPRIDAWSVLARLTYDPTLLRETELRRVVDDCGARVGLLDFRPERKGPFGRFMVTSWMRVME